MKLAILITFLLNFGSSATTTFLSFSRRIETCDNIDDLPLEDTTTKVIWAYNNQDPISNTAIAQHEARGIKSVRFFDTKQPQLLPNDTQSFEIKLNKTKITFDTPFFDKATQYWCSGYQINLTAKRQLIRMEPIVQKGNEDVVHHVLVYQCPILNETDFSYLGSCYDVNMPFNMRNCVSRRILSAWAVGGTTIELPQEAGLPINGTVYLLMETHFNNPTHREIIDSSGFRFWHTGQFRKYDAGITTFEHFIDPAYKIPAKQDNWRTDVWAPANCTNNLPSTGVNITHVFLHTHIAGRQVYLRQYRNGTELPMLDEEKFYDFNYQEWSVLRKERVLLPNDVLKLECIYNTADRNSSTPMGFSTYQEMCVAFYLYYPYVPGNDFYVYINYTGLEPSPYNPLNLTVPTAYCGNVPNLTPYLLPNTPPKMIPYVPPVCAYNPPPSNNTQNFKYVTALNKTMYTNNISLDDSSDGFHLYWTIDRENGIYHAALEVKTAGWIGFGISGSGGMGDSDVLIGWQSDGVIYFGDRYAYTEGQIPREDKLQDYFNVEGGEITETTIQSPLAQNSQGLVNRNTKIGVSVAGSVIGLILILLLIYICLRKRKKQSVVSGGATFIPKFDTQHDNDNNNHNGDNNHNNNNNTNDHSGSGNGNDDRAVYVHSKERGGQRGKGMKEKERLNSGH